MESQNISISDIKDVNNVNRAKKGKHKTPYMLELNKGDQIFNFKPIVPPKQEKYCILKASGIDLQILKTVGLHVEINETYWNIFSGGAFIFEHSLLDNKQIETIITEYPSRRQYTLHYEFVKKQPNVFRVLLNFYETTTKFSLYYSEETGILPTDAPSLIILRKI